MVDFTSAVVLAYKTASQSIANTASRATDGTAYVKFSLSSCSATAWQVAPWWRVDLEQSTFVNRVMLRNRDDAMGAQLTNFELRVGNSLTVLSNRKCGDLHSAATGASVTITCGDQAGRYVSVNLLGPGVTMLSICEVSVFSAQQPGVFTQRGRSNFFPIRTVSGAAQALTTTATAPPAQSLGDQVSHPHSHLT